MYTKTFRAKPDISNLVVINDANFTQTTVLAGILCSVGDVGIGWLRATPLAAAII
jgi:hypothetical protein